MASSDPDPLQDDSESQPGSASGQASDGDFIFPSSKPTQRPPSGEDATVNASNNRPTDQPTSDPNSAYDESASLSYEGEQDVIIGRYRLLEKIGRGTFGVVYRAEDQMLKRHVALKLLTRFQNANEVTAWLDEARVLASLDHPAIVPVFDVGKSDRGQPFIVSKLIEGGSLSQRASQESWRLNDSMRVVTQLAHALSYLHRRGTMHRDIKPSNILITQDGDAILADFGLALPESGFGRGARFVGTPAYMSPEQARHEGHRVDGRSDIYSLGVVFYELLTGKRPFQAADREQLLDCIRNVEVRPPRQLNHAIPRELERICMKALSKKISDRYPTAADMAEELEQWRSGDLSTGSVASVRMAPIAVPDTLTTDRSIDLETVAVIPHGLRSFDSNDADFYRYLVAGVRDRNGIPESISFWTSRILSRVEDVAFRIGVLFGASGSGKSSLMRAGVLPLVESQVAAIYVDAKPEMLEAILSRQIRQAAGTRAIDGSLPEMLNAIREAGGLRSRKKLVIIIDQFEQWLNYHRQAAQPLLLDALRQCDGISVQAILIVRDDFVLGVSTFMDELEEPLQQHRNFVTVEPFSDVHAKQVLSAFGRAYGAINTPPTAAQTAFVDEAIRGFHSIGRVDPLQIALLAEMTKGKPWAPTTLKQMGGIEGLGVAFLEERLTGPSAHPFLRANELGVRRLLAELLPEDDTKIKRPAILESELCERLRDCASEDTVRKLIQTLDTEVRLTTPTSNMRSTSQSNSGGSSSMEPAIQLAHDYLVATTRKWLAIHQTGTRAGRVREQLREIATSWKAKPSSKRLPTLLEWLSIHWFTRRSQWTSTESQLMQTANRRWLSAIALGCIGLFGCLGIGGAIQHSMRGHFLAKSLANIDTVELPRLLGEIEQHRRSMFHAFVGMPDAPLAEDPARQPRIDLHTRIANANRSHDAASYTLEHLGELEVADIPGILKHLATSKIIDTEELVAHAELAIRERSPNALHLVALLATQQPDHPKWPSIAARALPILVREPSIRMLPWARLLLPAKSHFTLALLEEGKREAESGNGLSEALITLFSTIASEDKAAMAKAIAWTSPDRIQPLLIHLTDSNQGADAIREELARRAVTPISATGISTELKSQLNSWGGILTNRGGWTEFLPQSKLLDTIQAMHALGIAPEAIRPVPSIPAPTRDPKSADTKLAVDTKFSVAWKPSDAESKVLLQLDRETMMAEFHRLSDEGWRAVDIARLSSEPSTAKPWMILLHKSPTRDTLAKQSLHLEVTANELESTEWQQRREEWDLRRCITTMNELGDCSYDLLLEEIGVVPNQNGGWESNGMEWIGKSDPWLLHSAIQLSGGDRYPGYPMQDMRDLATMDSNDRGEIWNDYREFAGNVEEKQAVLQGRSDQPPLDEENTKQTQRRLVTAFLNLQLRNSSAGRNEDALRALEQFLEENRNYSGSLATSSVLRVKAILLARNGRLEELEAILPAIEASNLGQEDKALLQIRRAILAADTELALSSLQSLEELPAPAQQDSNRWRENRMRGLALMAGSKLQLSDAQTTAIWERLKRAVNEFLSRDEAKVSHLLDCDFDPIRPSPAWRELLSKHGLSHRITTVYSIFPKVESRMLYQLSPIQHRQAASALLADGYYPRTIEWHYPTPISSTAMSVPAANLNSPKTPAISSVWHRTPRKPADAARNASSIASLAIALAALGQNDALARALEDGYGRSVYTATLAHAAKILPAKDIIKLLQTTPSNAMQCGLISALGEISWSDLDSSSRQYLTSRLPTLARTGDSPHLASLALWACRKWEIPLEDLPLEGMPPNGAFKKSTSPRLTNSIQQEMIRIEGPEFVLEKLDEGQLRANRELTLDTDRLILRTWCKLDRAYRLSSTEVTASQFQLFLSDPKVQNWLRFVETPNFATVESNLPQTKISWHLAIRFCQWLNERESIPENQWCYENVWSENPDDCKPAPDYLNRAGYRLPTLAEWTWACSAGSNEPFHFGSDQKYISLFEWTQPHSNDVPHPVGLLRPNPFGLFDMGGNLVEWTDSGYRGPIRDQRTYILDSGNETEIDIGQTKFILCGGRYRFSAQSAVSDSFVVNPASYQTPTTGFRVAQTILRD